ncbi:conserved hypothetical protein [Pseudomonas sp. 9AZ]|uniref:MbcA/ParS/Xre antitoxin family protein n=1 Tax=Pseudomonas sp. 9AZ TaxID=2653168 RepID=UPI0012F1C563|nr:MbcA/ParS/Xre antitoxin family protein [Pseudomonas sp. 9AZ]VXD03993.1 conserved hypothetical protein [Pseudomonas sp. 9AZ]
MTPELDIALASRHPKIYPPYANDGRFGFECLDGWVDLLDAAAGLIQKHVDETGADQVFARQVKEKFGGLRIYTWNADDRALAIFDLVEGLSSFICEECGRLGSITKRNGWLRCRCPEHLPSEGLMVSCSVPTEHSALILMELMDTALRFFEYNAQSCLKWLTQPALALGAVSPVSIISSDIGRNQILRLLRQIEFGVLP